MTDRQAGQADRESRKQRHSQRQSQRGGGGGGGGGREGATTRPEQNRVKYDIAQYVYTTDVRVLLTCNDLPGFPGHPTKHLHQGSCYTTHPLNCSCSKIARCPPPPPPPATHPTPLYLPPRWPSGKVSTSRAEDPGFESRLRRDFFGVESYQ